MMKTLSPECSFPTSNPSSPASKPEFKISKNEAHLGSSSLSPSCYGPWKSQMSKENVKNSRSDSFLGGRLSISVAIDWI